MAGTWKVPQTRSYETLRNDAMDLDRESTKRHVRG